MKVHYYLLLCSLGFVVDQIGAVIIPGRLWLMPIVFIFLMIFDHSLHRHYWLVAIFAIFVDIFSGFMFGGVAMILFGLACLIVVLRNWIRI